MKLVGLTYWLFLLPKYGKVQIFIHGNLEKCKKSVQGNLRKVQKISTQIKILYYRDLILLNKYIITIGYSQVHNL